MYGLHKGRLGRGMYWFLLGITASIYLWAWIYLSINMIRANHITGNAFILVVLCVPRLHDMGKSGWFVLFLGVPVLLAAMVGPSFSPEGQNAITLLMQSAIAGFVILLGIVRGDPKPNRWGAPPDLGLALRRNLHAEILRLTQEKDG
jgi:uncharacterized membrane protein YhaH (DUF805 family)